MVKSKKRSTQSTTDELSQTVSETDKVMLAGNTSTISEQMRKAEYKKEMFIGLMSIFIGVYMIIIFVNASVATNAAGNDISMLNWLSFYTFEVNGIFAFYAIIFGATRFISYRSKVREHKIVKHITNNNLQIALVVWLGISYIISLMYSAPAYRGMFYLFDDEQFFFHNFSFIYAVFLYFLVRGSVKAQAKWIPLIMGYPLVYSLIVTLFGSHYSNQVESVNGVTSGWVNMFSPDNFGGQVWPILILIAILFASFSVLAFALIRLKAWLSKNYYDL
jgi:hypothetical protein